MLNPMLCPCLHLFCVACCVPQNNFERNALDTFHLEYPVEQDPGYPISRVRTVRGGGSNMPS